MSTPDAYCDHRGIVIVQGAVLGRVERGGKFWRWIAADQSASSLAVFPTKATALASLRHATGR
jgi:hypothetical protein